MNPVPPHHPRDQAAPLVLAVMTAAVFLQDLVWIVVVQLTDGRWPATPGIVAMALVYGQTGVAIALVSWLAEYSLLRGALFLLSLALAGLLAATAGNQNFGNWLGLISLISAVVAVPLVGVRLAGGSLRGTNSPPSGGRSQLQFTIWGLISLTTLVATGLGVARFIDFPWLEFGAAGLFSLAVGIVPWVALPLALSRVRAWLPILATVVVAPLAGWLMARTGFPPETHQRELIAMACLQGVLTLALCWVVRAAGYRLLWPK